MLSTFHPHLCTLLVSMRDLITLYNLMEAQFLVMSTIPSLRSHCQLFPVTLVNFPDIIFKENMAEKKVKPTCS